MVTYRNGYTGIPCFIAVHRYCIFYELKVCGNLVLSKSVATSLPRAFAHLMPLLHFGNFWNISNYPTALHATEKWFMKG